MGNFDGIKLGLTRQRVNQLKVRIARRFRNRAIAHGLR